MLTLIILIILIMISALIGMIEKSIVTFCLPILFS